MNSGLFITGFGLGTIKFVFAHWSIYWAFGTSEFSDITEIFISVTAGAWFSMSIFYWTSGYLMRRAARKRREKMALAIKMGMEIPRKKVFTKMNIFIVWVKRKIGIYGVTLIAPLFLSIPIGSIICAKFYGHKKRTFPLMIIFTGTYSFLMCLWIYFQ